MRDYLEELLGQLPQGEEEELAAQWLPPSGRWSGWDGAIQDTLGELWEALGGRFQELQRSTAERAALSSSDALGETAAFLTAVLEEPREEPTAPERGVPGEKRRAASVWIDTENAGKGQLDIPERQEEARRRPALLLQVQALERASAQLPALVRIGQRDGRPLSIQQNRGASDTLDGEVFPTFRTAWRQAEGWPGGQDPAQVVDRAFQQDSRRYDRGFSLY